MSSSMRVTQPGANHGYQANSSTQTNIPAAANIDVGTGDPFMDCTRAHVVSILDSQIEACVREDYRLSLVLIQIEKDAMFKIFLCGVEPGAEELESDRREAIEILCQTFRPVDIVLRYDQDVFAVVLPGGAKPINLIREEIRSRLVHLGSLSGFGMSAVTGKCAQSSDAGEILLSTAEMRLRASKEQFSFRAY